jgi:hypothetical protein
VANQLIGIPGMTSELKSGYSKMLLDRLVPALEHVNHFTEISTWKWEGMPPNNNPEFVREVNKWRDYFNRSVIELEHV